MLNDLFCINIDEYGMRDDVSINSRIFHANQTSICLGPHQN